MWAREIARHRIDTSKLTQLRSVAVTASSIAMVSRLPSVTTLNAPDLDPAEFARLSTLSAVEHLEIPRASLSALAAMPMARSLMILEVTTSLEPADVDLLQTLPQLSRLQLVANDGLPSGLDQLPALETLTIKTHELVDGFFDSLRRLSSLNSLTIGPSRDRCTANASAISSLGQLSQLTRLRLPSLCVRSPSHKLLDPIGQLTNLTALEMKTFVDFNHWTDEESVPFLACDFLSRVSRASRCCLMHSIALRCIALMIPLLNPVCFCTADEVGVALGLPRSYAR